MIRIGIVSYNIYCNFTNYGSALQSWALYQSIKRISPDLYQPVLVDYCPDSLSDKDPLNPFSNMWDQDPESRKMCELSLPAIRINYQKFYHFYHTYFGLTSQKYTSENFNSIAHFDDINHFVCGSDTIFCINEFNGFDDGYFANYDVMKGNSVSYAASFGDAHFDTDSYQILNNRLQNFLAIGLRENKFIPYLKEHIITEKYLLLYARRYNKEMEAFAEKIARDNGWTIVEISLRSTNSAKGHKMFYEAGVEEFLSLVKYSEYVITNSFHGLIFAVQYRKQLAVFSRESGDNKIAEVLELFDLKECLLPKAPSVIPQIHDYDAVHARINTARETSLDFLTKELNLLNGDH